MHLMYESKILLALFLFKIHVADFQHLTGSVLTFQKDPKQITCLIQVLFLRAGNP